MIYVSHFKSTVGRVPTTDCNIVPQQLVSVAPKQGQLVPLLQWVESPKSLRIEGRGIENISQLPSAHCTTGMCRIDNVFT